MPIDVKNSTTHNQENSKMSRGSKKIGKKYRFWNLADSLRQYGFVCFPSTKNDSKGFTKQKTIEATIKKNNKKFANVPAYFIKTGTFSGIYVIDIDEPKKYEVDGNVFFTAAEIIYSIITVKSPQ